MNKKLFLILVLVTAILVTGAWVLAAKRSPTGTEAIKQAPEDVRRVETPAMAPTLPKLLHQQSATSMPEAPAIEKQAAIVEATGHPQKGAISQTLLSGTPIRLGVPSGKDLCNLAGTAAWFVSDWIYGLEYYANYQDPAEHGCTAVWPFQVTEIDFQLNFPDTMDITLQGFIFQDTATSGCPWPEDTPGFISPCSTAVYTYSIPAGGGYFELPLPLTEECCVYAPYFAVVYIYTDLYGLAVDMVSEDGATATCRSYNDYGSGWIDLLTWPGFPGPIMLYSQGYTMPQNDCPTQGDTCGVSSITPSTITVLAGGTATFTANVYFQGAQTSCVLTVTPDPACPSCVTTITPNPVLSTAPSATITIATDPSTPPGTYVFDVGGAKASATLIVVAPNDTCEIARWISAPGYYFDGWSAGDQNAVLMDPAMCISCGPDLYPFHIRQVKSRWVNWSAPAATSLDVIFHVYEAPTPYCDGPGVEIYQFPATIAAWSPDYVTVNLPDIVCVNGPFWLSAEYVAVQPAGNPFPALRMSNQTYDVACSQFNYYQGAWYEWADFWSPPPPGYFYLSAIGQCEGDECPIECYLIQDPGEIAYYFGNFAAGDVIAKYFDPELYCEPPVYPLKIHDVDFVLYDFEGVGTVDIIVDIHMVCHDSCDGPGTPIYRSEPFTITTFYPSMAHIDLNDVVCVNEPFFITLEYASGIQGYTPSFLWSDETYPCDSCHAWLYWASGGYPFWTEWHDFWSPPAGGCPIIRVSAATNHFDCLQEPCDTTQNVLADYGDPTWIWALPSTSGRNYPNQRFNLPADFGGRLDEVRFMFYGAAGDPNPTIYVWATDGAGHPWDNNPPYQALAEFPILTAAIAPFPDLTVVQTWQRGIFFDPEDEFFVGYSFVFDPGDALSLISDDYDDPLNTSDRAGFYWPDDIPPVWLNCFESYGIYMSFIVEAVICPEAPPAPTFTLDVTPTPLYVTPGDPPVHYTADVGQVLGYSQPVTLDLADVSPSPAPGTITATFTPNGQVPPYSSDVQVTADALVPYGLYALTIRGTGAKDIVRTKIVNLIVQPPFDEVDVPFFHGSQKATNFGAVGNDAEHNNFLWYGRTDQLFDGSFIVATTDSGHMALDVFNCEHWGWTPTAHESCYFNPDYNANICYGNFYTTEDVISCEHDSVFIVGIMDSCIDFSIKIKVYYNPTTTPIVGMYPAIYEDWDVGRVSAETGNNTAEMDPAHNLMWQYATVKPDTVFGIMKAPFDDLPMHSMVAVANPRYVYPNAGWCAGWGLDSLYYLISTPGYYNTATSDTDMSLLMSAPPIDLPPVIGKHIEVWIDFGFAGDFSDEAVRRMWYHRVLRYAGFYRGDVNASDSLEVPALDATDLVYLIQYLFQDGPAPKPYKDQGDVNGSCCSDFPDPKQDGVGCVNVLDVVYLINYVFNNGPAPVDYVRFIPQCWWRWSLFENPNWR